MRESVIKAMRTIRYECIGTGKITHKGGTPQRRIKIAPFRKPGTPMDQHPKTEAKRLLDNLSNVTMYTGMQNSIHTARRLAQEQEPKKVSAWDNFHGITYQQEQYAAYEQAKEMRARFQVSRVHPGAQSVPTVDHDNLRAFITMESGTDNASKGVHIGNSTRRLPVSSTELELPPIQTQFKAEHIGTRYAKF